MRALAGLVFAVIFLAVGVWAQEKEADDGAIPPRRYHAYWLRRTDGGSNGYQRLLVTVGPLDELVGLKFGGGFAVSRPLPLDHPAITFTTVGRDSLWDDPFRCVPEISRPDAKTNVVAIEDVSYAFEPCPIDEVVRLLENPLGSQGVHRRAHPLAGARETARAFVRLLRESKTDAE